MNFVTYFNIRESKAYLQHIVKSVLHMTLFHRNTYLLQCPQKLTTKSRCRRPLTITPQSPSTRAGQRSTRSTSRRDSTQAPAVPSAAQRIPMKTGPRSRIWLSAAESRTGSLSAITVCFLADLPSKLPCTLSTNIIKHAGKKVKERMADLERRAGDGAKITSKASSAVSMIQEQTAGEIDTESPHISPAIAHTHQPDHEAHHEDQSFVAHPRSFMTPSASSSQVCTALTLCNALQYAEVSTQGKVVSPPKSSPLSSGDLYVASPSPLDYSSPLAEYTGTQNPRSQSEVGPSDAVVDAVPPKDPMLGFSIESKGTQKHPATFHCYLCPKRFTRAYNFRSHLLTHSDERPFVCTFCGKAFARQHDRKRHENLHPEEKRFVCKGNLNYGTQWGCGRRFARADALAQHIRSEAGSICIKPLMDNEGLKLHSEDFDTVRYRFPAAVLAQYPALANVDWTTANIQAEDSDDRSRFNSSDYESDDAGYVSGTETGFGDTSGSPHTVSLYNSRDAADDSKSVWPRSKKRGDDKGPKSGPKTFPKTREDKSSSTDNGATDPERQSPVEAVSHPELNHDRSQLYPGQDNGESVNETEVSLHESAEHHHSDDNMSLRSFTESVFDNASIVSSASSLHSNIYAMVTSFVDMLVRDPSMDSLLAITTSEFGVTSGRFTRNFSRILKSYSRHLQRVAEGGAEETRGKHLIAAKSVRNARHQISNLIATRYNERAPTSRDYRHRDFNLISRHLKQTMPEESYEPSSNDESCEDELDFTLGDLEQFLFHGEPFRHLKRVLWSLVIPDNFMQYIFESVLAFLDLVLSDRRIRSFSNDLRHAIDNREDVGSDLNTQIRIMAAKLGAECTYISQFDASIFLETYSQYISMIAIDHVKDVSTAPSQTFQDLVEHIPKAPIPHEDLLEKILADTLPSVLYVDLMSHRKFLANSSAFASFIGALRGLAYPTFFSEATKFAKATIRSAEMSEDSLLAVEGHRLLPILSEMQSCLRPRDTSISFSLNVSGTRATALDQAKIAIEASTASEWDWWPLQPPRHPGSSDRAEFMWTCVCSALPLIVSYLAWKKNS